MRRCIRIGVDSTTILEFWAVDTFTCPVGGAAWSTRFRSIATANSEPLTEYLTTVLGREAASYIRKHSSPSATSRQPWFLYLAFNAPHTPLQATDELLTTCETH